MFLQSGGYVLTDQNINLTLSFSVLTGTVPLELDPENRVSYDREKGSKGESCHSAVQFKSKNIVNVLITLQVTDRKPSKTKLLYRNNAKNNKQTFLKKTRTNAFMNFGIPNVWSKFDLSLCGCRLYVLARSSLQCSSGLCFQKIILF